MKDMTWPRRIFSAVLILRLTLAPAGISAAAGEAEGSSSSTAEAGSAPLPTEASILSTNLVQPTGLVQQAVLPVDIPITAALAAGADHSLALTDDGNVWAWGQNQYGQLGQGTRTNLKIPRQVEGLPAVKAVAAGAYFSLALGEDGRVYAWGQNRDGQLGIGSSEEAVTEPIRIGGLEGIVEIDAGFDHAMARKGDGTVYVWGDNEHGQLACDELSGSLRPVEVTDGKVSGIKEMAAGGDHCLVRKADGTLLAWGDNTYGQLGDGSSVTRREPTVVSGVDNVKQISAGLVSSLALTEEGDVYAWGHSYYGELGFVASGNYFVNHPYKVSSLSEVRKIEMGFYTSFFLLEDGSVKACGQNYDGQLGDGYDSSHWTPVAVSGLDNVSQVAAGGDFTLALLKSGKVMSWGDNAWGQLGNGSIDESEYASNPDNYLPQLSLGGHWGGPVLESSSPAAGSTLRDLEADIELVFDMDAEAGSNLAGITLIDAGGEEVAIHRVVENGKIILCPAQSLEAGTHYTVDIAPNSVQDLAGNLNNSGSQFHFNT